MFSVHAFSISSVKKSCITFLRRFPSVRVFLDIQGGPNARKDRPRRVVIETMYSLTCFHLYNSVGAPINSKALVTACFALAEALIGAEIISSAFSELGFQVLPIAGSKRSVYLSKVPHTARPPHPHPTRAGGCARHAERDR